MYLCMSVLWLPTWSKLDAPSPLTLRINSNILSYLTQMPSDMTRAVRLYHTPDQMKQALKNSWARSQSAAKARTAADHSFQISEEPDIVSDSSLARRRSAAARAILDEASSGGYSNRFQHCYLCCISCQFWLQNSSSKYLLEAVLRLQWSMMILSDIY